MTLIRSIAILFLCCLLFPGLSGQSPGRLAGSTQLSAGQLSFFETMATDSVGGELDVPNVFTPNGDDVNDYFEVTTDGTTLYEFSVFTRTGTRIFYSLSPRIFWDGKSTGGMELPVGIYYYVIGEDGGSDPFEKAGFIHLFR